MRAASSSSRGLPRISPSHDDGCVGAEDHGARRVGTWVRLQADRRRSRSEAGRHAPGAAADFSAASRRTHRRRRFAGTNRLVDVGDDDLERVTGRAQQLGATRRSRSAGSGARIAMIGSKHSSTVRRPRPWPFPGRARRSCCAGRAAVRRQGDVRLEAPQSARRSSASRTVEARTRRADRRSARARSGRSEVMRFAGDPEAPAVALLGADVGRRGLSATSPNLRSGDHQRSLI